MTEMETVMLVTTLVASVVGTLILLACLAGRRAELVKAFNVQREAAENDSDTPAPVAHSRESVPVVDGGS